MIESPKTGDCYFASTAILLFGEIDGHDELRLRTATFMMLNRDVLEIERQLTDWGKTFFMKYRTSIITSYGF